MSPTMQKGVSAFIAAIGAALMVMMITTEGELGALPPGLLAIGVAGYVGGWVRQRSSPSRPPRTPNA